MKFIFNLFLVSALLFTACKSTKKQGTTTVVKETVDVAEAPKETEATANTLIYPNEKHFKNMRQLTFGGDNAEAYWSFDDSKLVMQSNYDKWDLECDQIFYFDVNSADLKANKPKMLSTGLGRTTCA